MFEVHKVIKIYQMYHPRIIQVIFHHKESIIQAWMKIYWYMRGTLHAIFDVWCIPHLMDLLYKKR